MPQATAAALSRIQNERPHELEWFLAVAPFGDPIWTGMVNDNAIVRGAMAIEFDSGVGDIAGVLRGMTLWVGQTGTATGLADLGTVRIRGVTGSYIYVAENDDIVWLDDQHLIVPGEAGFRELWGVFPRLVEGDPVTFYKDYDVPYTDEGDRIPPKANAGPPVIDTIYAASGTSVTLFIGEDSWAAEVGGDPIVGWYWNFADGIPATSLLEGTRAAPIEVCFPTPGFRYVELTVIDTLGTTGTTYVPVWISADDTHSNLYWRLEVRDLAGSLENGWRASFKVWEADESDFPDQALIVLGCKSRWAGVEDNDVGGYPHRGNIRFVGWLDRETLTFDATVGTVEFEAICSAQVMDNLPGFSVSIDEDPNPENWTEMYQPNVDKLMQHLLEFHSTVNQVCHVEAVGEGATRQVPCPQVFQKNSILKQVNEDLLIDAQCRLASNRQGLLIAAQNPQMLDQGAPRDAIPVVCSLVNRDFQDNVIEAKPHRPILGHVDAGGFDANETPLLSQAPGACPLQQSRDTRFGELILIDQTELNIWSGLHLAEANNPYPRMMIDVVGNWPIFDTARQEYVRVTATDPLSRNPLSDQRFVVRGIRFEEQPDGKTTTTALELEMESWGPPGETVPVPDPPPPDDPNPPPEPILPPFGPPDRPVKVVIVWTQDQIGRSSDFLRHHVVGTATVGTGGTDLYDSVVDFGVLELEAGDAIGTCGTGTASTTVAAVLSKDHIELTADIGLGVDGTYYTCGTEWTNILGSIPGTDDIIQFVPVQTGDSSVGGWVLTDQAAYWASNVLSGTPNWTAMYTLATLRAYHGDLAAADFRGIAVYPGNSNFVIISFTGMAANSGFGAVYSNARGVGAWLYSNFPIGDGCHTAPYFGITVDDGGLIYTVRNCNACLPGPANHARMLVSADGGANFAWTVGSMATNTWNSTRYELHIPGGNIQAEVRTNVADDDSPKYSGNAGASWTSHMVGGYTGDTYGSGISGHYDTGSHIVAIYERNADSHYMGMRTDGGAWFEIGDATILFNEVPGVWAGVHVIRPEVWTADEEVMGWVAQAPSGWGGFHTQRRILYTENYAECWSVMMGDWYTVFGSYNGTSGSSGDRGNVGIKFLPRFDGDDD